MKVELLNVLTCPVCKDTSLKFVTSKSRKIVIEGKLICQNCKRKFSIKNGIPLLIPDELRGDVLRKKLTDKKLHHKIAQIDEYHRVDCSENSLYVNRPHCYNKVQNFLFTYPLEVCKNFLGNIEGKKILDVCCGGGADAEYFYRLGAKVCGIDISYNYLKCAITRSKKYNVDTDLLVGDVENLPIKSKSFDYGIVHCGLHHLPDPYKGIKELNRISKNGIVIIESFNTLMTKLFIKLGLSGEVEHGTPIYRFNKKDLIDFIKKLGFEKYKLKTFFLYSREEPLHFYDFFENDYLFKIFKIGFKIINFSGKFGNRFVLVARK